MPLSINCTSYRHNGICTHQAAPRRLFRPAECIVWLSELNISNDLRVMPVKCRLCTPTGKVVLQSGERNGN